ncbi:RNA polymerase sigma factor [Jatrophihabitans sp. YIM 134969]
MNSSGEALADAAPPGTDGFEAAYDDLFARHWLGLVRLARLLVDDTTSAEDVVQDAFLGLYRQRAALADPTKALAYLRAAVVNRSRSVIRRRVVARRHLRVAEPETGPAADAPVLLAEEHRAVLAAVEGLPRRQREVLVLRAGS